MKREKREEKSACKQTNEANEAKAKRDGNLVAKKKKKIHARSRGFVGSGRWQRRFTMKTLLLEGHFAP